MKIVYLFIFMIPCISLADTFTVGLPIIPKLIPATNQISVGNYIGLHLYYPLFSFETSGILESKFLDLSRTSSKDQTFTKYSFCLKDRLTFSDGTRITVGDLYTSLKNFSNMYPHLLPIKGISKGENGCVEIDLLQPTPNLFKRLTGVASTVVKESQIEHVYPIGYGPYRVAELTDDILKLEFAGKHSPRFEKIKFQLVKKISGLEIENYLDTNHLPPVDISKVNKNKFRVVDAPTLKVYSIVINLKRKSSRKSIQCQLSKIDWMNGYGLSLAPQKHFLPQMQEDSKTLKFSSDTCQVAEKKIPYLITENYDVEKIKNLLKTANVGNSFEVKKVSTNSFAEWAFSGKEYIALMAFDSSGSISSLEGDFSVYFESFFSKQSRIVTMPIKVLEQKMSLALRPQKNSDERKKIMNESDNFLVENGYVLPIGRAKRFFVFPNNIEITEWADFFSGFPQIDKIR